MKNIAIIGGGISGLTAAYYLRHDHQVTIFEANDYIGGHTATVSVADHRHKIHDIDTGFIVFNDRTYPLFEQLLFYLRYLTKRWSEERTEAEGPILILRRHIMCLSLGLSRDAMRHVCK